MDAAFGRGHRQLMLAQQAYARIGERQDRRYQKFESEEDSGVYKEDTLFKWEEENANEWLNEVQLSFSSLLHAYA